MAEETKTIGNETVVKSGKGRIQVSLLDDTVVAFQVEPKAKGLLLYQKVNGHLKVEESDYFGLQYYDAEGNMCWLDPQKSINKQVKEALTVTFKFRVMFYTPDPNSLQEYTRYLFTLQVRRDLLDGRLHCSEDTGALLASYIVQGELGDFDEKTHQNGYLSGFQFVPHQSPEIEEKILQYHMTHRGKSPAEADRSMLEVARQLEMYGITLYPAKDRDDADLSLSVYHMGILVFQNQKKINMFSWAKIRKLSFKKKKFLIKLHSKVYTADLVEFVMQSRNACKGFWKICIAHHVFFRQKQALQKKAKPTLLSRGSKFRYSGRTQKQLMEDCKDTFKPVTNDLERSRASRIHRASDATPGSSDFAMLPTTPPPSYSSFQFDSTVQFDSTAENSQSTSSVKNSTDASEDEGSFAIDSARSPPIHLRSGDEIRGIEEDAGSGHSSRPDAESYRVLLSSRGEVYGNDDIFATAETEDDETRLWGKNGIEVESEVHPRVEQMSKSTSWQYHLTTTELDDNALIDGANHCEASAVEADSEHTNGDLGHFSREILDHLNFNSGKLSDLQELDTGVLESNGDVNSNDVDDAIKVSDKQPIEPSLPQVDGKDYESDSGESATNEHVMEIIGDGDDINVDINVDIGRCLSEDALDGAENQENGYGNPESLSYHMAREVLLTERTYIKDLEILTVSFREVIKSQEVMSQSLMALLFENVDPLYDFHCSFLAELEDRLSCWKEAMEENRDESAFKISDIMLSNMRNLKLYVGHIKVHDQVLLEFQKEISNSKELSTACKEFELSKLCYLPLNTLLLKPAQRLFYYKHILSRMHKELSSDDPNLKETKAAYDKISEIYKSVSGVSTNLENLHKLIELNRDLVGVDDLVHPKRDFIREGCLYKVSRRGPQPRMFFLFSDTLLYTSQELNEENQFCASLLIPLQKMKIKDGGLELHGLYPFTIELKSGKSFVFATTSVEDRLKWTEDIKTAVSIAENRCICSQCKDELPHEDELNSPCRACKSKQGDSMPPPLTLRSPSKGSDSDYSESLMRGVSTLDRKHAHVGTLSTRRVCWHRNTSISMNEYKISAQNNISGNLLRKSKNQAKWRRLWVIFTNFSLFFFKSYEDDEPLASLPLIGYDVSKPNESDNIEEEFCFKLHFKAHAYFFRAENQYSYQRWMEALTSITRNSSRARIFSRLTSA